MKSNLLLLMVICLMLQCCTTRQPTPNNLVKISNKFKIDTAKIRFDGIYNTYDTSLTPRGEKSNEISVTDAFVIFLINEKIIRIGCCTKDSVAFQAVFYESLDSSHFGSFKIDNDSIFAYIPSLFFNRWGQASYYNANYSGYIKNQDTILNWKMIPPYPDVNDNFTYKTTPRMLYFIKNDAVRCLDSIAGK